MDFSNLSPKITTPSDRNCTYKVDGKEDGQGYLSPQNTNSEIGLIVIQEWWGLNQSLANTCDILAAQGFRALCPDVYRGKVAKDHEEAGHLMTGLDWAGAIADVIGAAKHLKSLGCKKVGITGFCMGGALAIATLANTDQIDAGCPFYGIPDLTHINLGNVKQPVYAHFGETDALKGFSSPDDAKNLEAKAKELGLVNFSIKIWPQVGHAFMNQDSKYYAPETAQLALQEIVAFFKKWLV